MPVLNRIAYFRGRRDEVPNQVLAKDLVARRDARGIAEIAAGLRHKVPAVRSDCVKVLYEVGYLRPELIARYAPEFFRLLQARNNRLVWGAMTALSAIAAVRPKVVFDRRREILPLLRTGSVITVDHAVVALARVAASSPARRTALLPALVRYLGTCRPKDIPQYSEKIVMAVDPKSRAGFIRVLTRRLAALTPSQQTRVRKVIRSVEGGG